MNKKICKITDESRTVKGSLIPTLDFFEWLAPACFIFVVIHFPIMQQAILARFLNCFALFLKVRIEYYLYFCFQIEQLSI